MRFEGDSIEMLPEPLAEDGAYVPIREALDRRLGAGASSVEAVKQVAAELDEEGQREMIEPGLLCLVFAVFD